MCRKLIFGGVILLTSLLSLSAQADWSQSSLLFLTFEPDAASYGRGGTGVAIVAGPEAAFYNPAAIGLIKDYSVTGSYLPYIDYSDLAFWHLSGGYSFGDDGILALSANYFDLGRSERTDEMGNSLGEYFSYDLAVGITYALQLEENFWVGATGKYLRSSLAGTGPTGSTANAFGFDSGVLFANIFPLSTFFYEFPFSSKLRRVCRYSNERGFSIGAAVLNLGPELKYSGQDQGDPLPQLLRFGVAYRPIMTDPVQLNMTIEYEKLLVGVNQGFSTEFLNGSNYLLNFGLEANIFYLAKLRFGRRQQDEKGPYFNTWGFGLGPDWAHLDLAVTPQEAATLEDFRVSLYFSYPLHLVK